MSVRLPSHPGEIVKEEFLVPLGLSVQEGARAFGIEIVTLEQLVGEKTAVTPELALRLEEAFGPSAEMWLRLQMSHDLAGVRRRGDIHVSRYPGLEEPDAMSGTAA